MSCATVGGCHGLGAFVISGDFLQEGTGWLDSIQVLRGLSTGPTPDVVYDLAFDGVCYAPWANRGAILVTAPPKNAKPRPGA